MPTTTTARRRGGRPRRRGAATILASTLVAAALLPASPASADSIAFVKDANVWLTSPDGARQHQVTTDGTAEYPYRSPSQADDGTIAVSHGQLIKRLRQNGQVINTIDPPALVDSTSRPVDGVPVAVAISPDGAKIAYSFASYSCPIAWECGHRSVTGITHADRFTPTTEFANATFGNPRWVGNGRLLVTGGYLHHINLLDIAPGSTKTHWFDDQNYFGDSSDLGEGVVSRDGRRVAAVHGYDGEWPGSVRRIIWLNVRGDVIGGRLPAARPDGVCITSPTRGTHSPTWSPDGSGLAFTLPEGLHVARGVPTDPARCGSYSSSLVIPGATEPDWGPADINPQPLPPPGNGNGNGAGSGNGSGSGSGSGNGSGSGSGKGSSPGDPKRDADRTGSPRGTVALAGAAKLRAALRSGLRVSVRGAAAGRKVTVRLRVDAGTARRLRLGGRAVTLASGTARTSSRGAATVRLRFNARAAKALKKQRTLRATISAPGAAVRKVTLR